MNNEPDTRVYSTVGFRSAVYSELINLVHTLKQKDRSTTISRVVNKALEEYLTKIKEASK